MGRSADYTRQNCAIAATLDLVGEAWTLLIIRDSLRGLTRFDQWQDSLGLARNVLAARLKHLVAEGIFETRLYCERPKRYEYVLTDKGHALRPMLLHLMDWGLRHVYVNEPCEMELTHSCGQPFDPVTRCAHCNGTMDVHDFTVQLHPDAPSIAELYDRRLVTQQG